MSQHLLQKSRTGTPKLLNEHLCLHPRQTALSVGLRKVFRKALPQQQRCNPSNTEMCQGTPTENVVHGFASRQVGIHDLNTGMDDAWKTARLSREW